MTVDSRRIACECVQIPPKRIFKFVHRRFRQFIDTPEGSLVVQVVWPMEAHIWAREAIADKDRKIAAYRRNSGVQDIDLLLHAPYSVGNLFSISHPVELAQIKWAARLANSSFTNIYFWNPKAGIEKVYPLSSSTEFPQLDLSQGYPTSSFLQGRTGKIVTTQEGEPPEEYDFGIIEPALIIIPPTDPEFRELKPHLSTKRYLIRNETKHVE